MTDADRPAFAAALFLAGEVFNEPVTEARAEAYFGILKPYDVLDVVAAIQVHMNREKWFPKPVEIMDAMCPHGSVEANAEAMWQCAISGENQNACRMYLGINYYDFKQLTMSEKLRLRRIFVDAFKREDARLEHKALVESMSPKQITGGESS